MAGLILFVIGCCWSPIFKNYYIALKVIQLTNLSMHNEAQWTNLPGKIINEFYLYNCTNERNVLYFNEPP